MVMECVNEPSDMKGDKDMFYLYVCWCLCCRESEKEGVFSAAVFRELQHIPHVHGKGCGQVT